MSNGVRRRAISRLPRAEGGFRARKQHRRVLARWARVRAVQQQQMADAAKAMLDEEFGESDEEAPEAVVSPPRLVWGYGCGPGQQRAAQDGSEHVLGT